jgi:MSHA biogenesis protein MshQ
VVLGLKNDWHMTWAWVSLEAQLRLCLLALVWVGLGFIAPAHAVMVELNSTGGMTSTDGLHFYIDDSTQLQVRRLNNTGQVYLPSAIPPDNNLDNGIYLRANGRIFGPRHFAFNPSGGGFSGLNITPVAPANPAVEGVQQTTQHGFGVTSGPQVNVIWRYTKPFDFITAEVTLTIPVGYAVSSSNPVRYYHVVDTFLGGSDNGCGVRFTDSNGKLVIGTYPPPSGTTCPSSTAVPTGVSVVESFRERTGSFSNFCAGPWDRFWSTGGVNCAVSQSANMSNHIATTFQDTGIGIQYNFTAPGTYTFSYDFVVGSTRVPAYDHLEIRHPGTANLCPTNVEVLACTSSVVPCPAANIVNTGTLTGRIRTTPAAPTVTQTPSTFTLGSGASIATVSLQGSGAGVYLLSTRDLSSTPLDGTRCWNTATNTASCSFTITNTPCVSGFECIDSSQAYNNLTSSPSSRNPLFTQVAGNGFRFDVVALQSAGVQATSYTASSGVVVELFDDSASPQPACSAYSSPIASQAITFAAGDNGRKTVASNFVLNNAYPKLRCRVRDTNVGVNGCSSDNFSVRPSSFTVTSTANADAAGANVSAMPVVRAGATFSLTAASGVLGYNGVPQMDTTRLQAHSGAPNVGSITGTFSAANPANGQATAANARYSEVGYVRFASNGVFDTTFTAIDSAVGDCAPGFVAAGGRQACGFGNAATTAYFGRFIPDHFAITAGTTLQGCSGGFTYLGHDGFNTNFSLVAQNTANVTTQNYTGSFVKLANTWANYQFTATGVPATASFLASATSPVATWLNGVGAINAKHQVSRPTTLSAPANISVFARPTDADGVTMVSTLVSPASEFRFGRLHLPNSYGSELLPLTANVEAQYWNGTAFVRNQLDSCTVVPSNSVAMGNYRKTLAACETQLTGSGTMVNGLTALRLSAPGAGNSGSVDLSVNLNAATGSTCNSATATGANSANLPWMGTANPSARATFGIYKTPVIYIRENF